jgi:hypothetical protein
VYIQKIENTFSMSRAEQESQSRILLENFSKIREKEEYQTMLKTREKLPVSQYTKDITSHIKNNQVVVITGNVTINVILIAKVNLEVERVPKCHKPFWIVLLPIKWEVTVM